MRVIRTVSQLVAWRHDLHQHGITVALVPTMGGLHAGHEALIRAARLSSDAVVVSLFVNPSQFTDQDDFTRYPRSFRADRKLCGRAGVDVLFAPSVKEMYPDGFETTVTLERLACRWEGEYRPGHFVGVATIVAKLFNLVRPHRAFFGQKDYQQSLVVRRLVLDLDIPVTVEVWPTVREPDGLALSSRNVRLAPAHRRRATVLYRALSAGERAIRRGERSGRAVQRVMRACLDGERGVRADYLAVCDPETLEPISRIERCVVLLGAVRVGGVRLIDNVVVGPLSRGRSAGR